MNKIYRTVYNETTNTWVAVEETAKSHRKSAGVVNETAPAREVLSGSLNKMPVIASLAVIAQGSLDAVKKALALTLLTAGGIAGAANVDGSNVGNAGYGENTYNAKSDLVIGVNGETVADKKANSNGRNTIIGNEAKIVNTVGKVDSAVAIGAGAEAGNKSVAIGGTWTGEDNTQATAYKSVALGYGASAITPGSGLSVGTMALGAHATAIGSNNNAASSMDSSATAIGYYSYANGGQALALGARTRADALQSTAIGNDSLTTGRGAVAIGGDDSGPRSGATGYSNAKFTYTGYQKLEGKGIAGQKDINGVQIEAFRPTYAADAASTAISPHAQALTQGSTAIGVGATAGKGVQTKVQDTGDYYEKSTFTPDTDAVETTAVGAMATALEKRSTALGYYSSALGVSSTSVGDRANARGENSTAIGALSLAQANDSGAIGAVNYVGAINNSDTTNTDGAENSWAIGNYNNVTSTNTFVIGNYVNAKLDAEGKPIAIKDANGFITGYESLTEDGTIYNSVYLGDRSAGYTMKDAEGKPLDLSTNNAANTTAGLQEYTHNLNDIKYVNSNKVIKAGSLNFAGGQPVGVVTVGERGKERRIQNVAAGLINENSTDAINGSQLYSVIQNLPPIETDNRAVGVAHTDVAEEIISPFLEISKVEEYTKAYETAIRDAKTAAQAKYNSDLDTWKADNPSATDAQIKDKEAALKVAMDKSIQEAVKKAEKDNHFAQAYGEQTIAMGYEAKTGEDAERSTAIGYMAQTGGEIALGDIVSLQIDPNDKTKGTKKFSVNGEKEQELSELGSVKIDDKGVEHKGVHTGTGVNSVAVGEHNKVLGNNSTAVGQGNIVLGNRSIAIGDPNIIIGDDSGALGNDNVIAGNKAFVVGNNVNKTADNSVFLGDSAAYVKAKDNLKADDAGSTAGVSRYVTNAKDIKAINEIGKETDVVIKAGSLKFAGDGMLYTYTASIDPVTNKEIKKTVAVTAKDEKDANGKDVVNYYAMVNGVETKINESDIHTAGVVSVGDVGAERRIQNVAAGLIDAQSTDAINGSQLYSVIQNLKPETTPVTPDPEKGIATYTVENYFDKDGNPLTKNEKGEYFNADGSKYTGDANDITTINNSNKFVTAGDVVNTINNVYWSVDAKQDGNNADPAYNIKAGNLVDLVGDGVAIDQERLLTDGKGNEVVKVTQDDGTEKWYQVQLDKYGNVVLDDKGNKVADTSKEVQAADLKDTAKFTFKADTTKITDKDGLAFVDNVYTTPNGTVLTLDGKDKDGKPIYKDADKNVYKGDVIDSGNRVVTANDVRDTINNVYWSVDAKQDGNNDADPYQIKAGNLVDLVGDGVDIDQEWLKTDGKGNEVIKVTEDDGTEKWYQVELDDKGNVKLDKDGNKVANKKEPVDAAKVKDTAKFTFKAESAQQPVVYTDADGNKLTKNDAGEWVNPKKPKVDKDGKPVLDDNGNPTYETVKPADVIASMNNGGDSTTTPMTLDNIASNLTPSTSDGVLIAPNGSATFNGTPVTKVGDKWFELDKDGKPTTEVAFKDGNGNSLAKPSTEMKAPTNALAMNNKAATVGDVLNAGWNLQGNGTAVDFVKPYDTVNFINGAGTTATVTSDGLVSKVTYNVNPDNKTTQINYFAGSQQVAKADNGKWYPVNKDGKPDTNAASVDEKTINNSQVAAKTTPLTMEENDDKTTTGKVKTPDAPDSLVTAGDVANAINNAHWNVQADKTTGGTVSGQGLQPIKAGDTVDLIAGENVTIKQEQGKFTFSVDIPDASTSPITAEKGKAKLGDVTTYTDADGNPLTQNSDSSYSNADGSPYTGDVNNITSTTAPADGNKLVTAGDVVNTINNTGWTVGKGSSSDTENDKLITPAGDNNRVGFVEGDGVTITQNGANFTFAVNKATAPAIATADGDTVKKSEVTKPDTNANKYWDANQVADAINNSGWRVTGADTNADGTGGFADTVVTPGDQITLEGGKNVALKQDGNKFIFSVELPEAEQLPVVYTDADGNKVVKNDDGKWVKPALDDDGDPIFDADGNPTTEEVAPENVIASMNNAGDSTTSPMTLSNVASHFADAGDNKTMPAASAPDKWESNKNEAATLGDVLNAGWNLQAEGKTVDFVTHGDTVNFASSNKTVTITDKSAKGKDIIDFVVNTDDKTIKPDGNGKLSVQTDGDTIIAGDNGLKVNTGGSQVDNNTGKAAPKDGDTNKIATVGDITDTINGVFWKVDASGNGSNAANANNVKAGHQVNFVGGDGVQIDQTNADATTTFTFKVDDSTLNTAGVHPLEFTGDDPDAGKLTPTHGGMVQIKGGATDGTTATEENAPATATGKNITVNPNGDALEVALAPNVDLGDKGSLKVGKDGENVTNITPEGVNVANKDGSTNVAPDQITFADKDGKPTNTGSIIGLASHLQDPTGKNQNPDKTGYPKVKNEAATVEDVLNAGWNLQGNGTPVDFVTHGDTVNFQNGKYTTVNVSQDDKGVNNVKVDVNLTGGKNIEITEDGVINYTGKDSDTITTLTANNGEKANETKGNIKLIQKGDNYDVALNNTITVGNEKDGDKPITIDGTTGDITLGGDNGGNINNVANHIKSDGSMIDDKAPTNQAATVQDVLNSGWNVKVGDADPEYIKHGDQVAFIDGKGTKVSSSKDGIAYDINVDQNSPLSINKDGALTVNVGGFDNTTDGSVKANNPNGLATAGDIANAVNNSGWNVTTSASTGEVSGTTKELIKPTNTVTFDAGDNIRIVQSGNQISVGTTRNINVAGNLNVAGDTTVNNLAVNPNSNVDMGGNQIHNVATGKADTDAVNVRQLRDEIGGNRNWEPRVNQVEKHANAGTAQAIATAGLPQVYLPGKNLVAIGGGVYRGESGYAVGFSSISDNGSWIFKATGSGNSRGNFGGSAAVGYQW